jgi:hypothetical protein
LVASLLPSPQGPQDRGLQQSHCACQDKLLLAVRPQSVPGPPCSLARPLNQTRCPNPPSPAGPAPHQSSAFISHSPPPPPPPPPPLLSTPSLSLPPHLSSPSPPPLAGPQRLKTCSLLARLSASCESYQRDGLRRPLDNGCSLMRSRTDELKLSRRPNPSRRFFVTTLL